METNENASITPELPETEPSSNDLADELKSCREGLARTTSKLNTFKSVTVLLVVVSLVLACFVPKSIQVMSDKSGAQTDYETLQPKYEELQADYDELKAQYATLEVSKKEADDEATRLKTTVEDLNDRIEELELEINSTPTPKPTATPRPGKQYDTGLSFKDISRNPDNHIGKKVKFSGRVLQIMEGELYNAIRMSTDGDYDDVVYATYYTSLIDFRLLEDDRITIYGEFVGMTTYESIFGKTITLPEIIIEKLVLEED